MTPQDASRPPADRSVAPPGTIDLPLTGGGGTGTAFSSGMGGSAVGPTEPPVGARNEPGNGGAAEPAPRLTGHRRQRVVTAGIAATTILSLLATSLLYYRWAKRPDPESRIVVWAGDDKSWDGARVTVRGGGLTQPLTYVLREDEHLIVRFHVPPGDYLVTVHGKDGRLLAQKQRPPQQPLDRGMIWWPFHPPAAATQLGLQ